MTVMSLLVLILSWGSMGLEAATAVGLSDFCSNPDIYILNLTQEETGLSSDILSYYFLCNQAVSNPFQQRLTLSQRALANIHSQLQGLEREAVPQFPSAQVGNFHQLVALLHCRGLHKVNPFSEFWSKTAWHCLTMPSAPRTMVQPCGACAKMPWKACSSCCSSPCCLQGPWPLPSAACPAPGPSSRPVMTTMTQTMTTLSTLRNPSASCSGSRLSEPLLPARLEPASLLRSFPGCRRRPH
uniref:Protein tweety homolog n=1 Tax=Prolemur simus TaxID=1328070 RepID=A0A8C8YVV2_PROSS